MLKDCGTPEIGEVRSCETGGGQPMRSQQRDSVVTTGRGMHDI